MVHVLYLGDVKDGEAVKDTDVKPTDSYRLKTKSGRYAHVLADSLKAAEEWAANN